MGYSENIDPETGRFKHPPVFNPDSPERGWYTSIHGDQSVDDLDWTAWLAFQAGALQVSPVQFEEMWDAMAPSTPNPMRPSGPPLKRHQGTWGRTYAFGGQVSHCMGPVAAAPELVQMAVEKTRRIAPEFLVSASEIDHRQVELIAHCNWYPTHDTALQPHQDDESMHVPGFPIFSFTFIQPPPGLPDQNYQYFEIQNGPGKVKVADRASRKVQPVPLRDGDLIVMGGTFQQDVWHGGPAAPAAARGRRRINGTVRAVWARQPDGPGDGNGAAGGGPTAPKRARVA